GAGWYRPCKLLFFKPRAVRVAEDRNQQLVGQPRFHRMPFDVEDAREPRARSVLQHILPPRVRRPADAHVVRHEVEQMAHAIRAERVDPLAVVPLGSEIRVEPRRIGDVVAVRAARDCSEIRRCVAIPDPELSQVPGYRARVAERKTVIELKTIRRQRYAAWKHEG